MGQSWVRGLRLSLGCCNFFVFHVGTLRGKKRLRARCAKRCGWGWSTKPTEGRREPAPGRSGAAKPPTPPHRGRPRSAPPVGRRGRARRVAAEPGGGGGRQVRPGRSRGGHPRPLLSSRSCFPPVFSPFVGCVLGGSDARRAAHPRRGSLFPASGLVLAAPGDGEGGGCRPAGMAVRMCPFGKSRSGGFFFWSVLGGDLCCSSVLQRVWAGGMPGWLVALDPLARWAAAGKRCTSGSLSSPGNMTKEDGSVPRKQVYWV